MARTIKTPGAPSADAPETAGEPDTSAADQAAPAAPVKAAAKKAAAGRADVAPAVPADELPNAIDVDARTIPGPVLTKQGWVCPDEAYQAAHRGIRPTSAGA